jgi:hypothetical protein
LNFSGKECIKDETVKKKEKISTRVLAGQAQITQENNLLLIFPLIISEKKQRMNTDLHGFKRINPRIIMPVGRRTRNNQKKWDISPTLNIGGQAQRHREHKAKSIKRK